MGLVVDLTDPDLGSDYAVDQGQVPVYDPDSSASAALAFPWAYACTRIRGAAMARIPIRVYRWEEEDGKQSRRYLDDHWLAGLAEHPNSYSSQNTFVQEIQADLDNDGNAYLVIVGARTTKPTDIARAALAGTLSLHRIPPKRMRVIPAPWGIKGYEFVDGNGSSTMYDPTLVLHIRRASFRDPVNERFYGVGAVRPLSEQLGTEMALARRDKQNASKGRPSVVLSPAADNVRLTPEQVKDVTAAYTRLTKDDGGALVMSGHMKLQPVSWTPNEQDAPGARDSNRSATLAAYRVPPVRAGLETANYATAREHSVVFWESIQDDAMLHAWAWQELARRAGERDIYVELDFSAIHELTTWKTEAISRANLEWLMGIDLIDALRVNGLHEEADILQAKADARKAAKAEQASADKAGSLRVVQWWGDARAEAPPMDDEEARAERWRAIDKQLLSVGERNLALATRRFLEQQAERVSDALEEEGRAYVGPDHQRDDIDSLIDRIFNSVLEARKFDEATRADIRKILIDAYLQGQIDIDEDGVVYNADRIDQLVDEVLGELVTNVTQATKSAVNEIVRTGLAEGQTIADMQLRLMQSQAFSPARALTIARTETTRSTGLGTVQAYSEAAPQLAEHGIIVKKQWLSSRDSAVRDDHRALDGQTVATDQPFTVPPGHPHTGATAQGPGGFSQAALSVNCRCAVVPVIERTG